MEIKLQHPKITELIISGVSIQLTRKNMKNIRMRISGENAQVRMSAPVFTPYYMLEKFVNKQLNWIKKNQTRVKNKIIPGPFSYETGEKHCFLGKKYPLHIVQITTGIQTVQFNQSTIILYSKAYSNKQKKEKLLDQWYRQELIKRVPEYIEKWQLIMGKRVAEWRIRKMKTRWGTCNIHKKRIWLSLELIKKPVQCLEYVIVHEMVHLYEPSHNKRFYRLMDLYMPNWKTFKDLLNN